MSWKGILWEAACICIPPPFEAASPHVNRSYLVRLLQLYREGTNITNLFHKTFSALPAQALLIYGAPFLGHTRPVRNGGNVSTRSRLGKFCKYIRRCWQIEETVGVCERAPLGRDAPEMCTRQCAGPIAAAAAAPVSHRRCDCAHLASAQSECQTVHSWAFAGGPRGLWGSLRPAFWRRR